MRFHLWRLKDLYFLCEYACLLLLNTTLPWADLKRQHQMATTRQGWKHSAWGVLLRPGGACTCPMAAGSLSPGAVPRSGADPEGKGVSLAIGECERTPALVHGGGAGGHMNFRKARL